MTSHSDLLATLPWPDDVWTLPEFAEFMRLHDKYGCNAIVEHNYLAHTVTAFVDLPSGKRWRSSGKQRTVKRTAKMGTTGTRQVLQALISDMKRGVKGWFW